LRQKSPEKLTELCLPYLQEAGLLESTGNKINNLTLVPEKGTKKIELDENIETLLKIMKI